MFLLLQACRLLLHFVLVLEPENTKYMSNLGYLSLKQGNPQEARRYFLTVLEFDSQDKIAAKILEELE